jgi:hypothetical protein
MSKKNRNKLPVSSVSPTASATPELVAEYRIIKHDLIRVVVINVVFLVAVLAVYYTNLQSHYLERWFQQVFKF